VSPPLHIPLFPLGTVLFPGGYLPLQIFEVRYLDMVKRCHHDGTPFGVVCLTEGHEVQQRDPSRGETFRTEGFELQGTLAHVSQLEQPRPGLMLIQCQGTQRFLIDRSEKLRHGLWMADVRALPTDMPVPVPDELTGMARALRQLHERLETDHPHTFPALPTWADSDSPWQDAGWLANRWAELLPLPPNFKQRLLALDSPLLRLELVGDALEQLGIAY
jgi:Lon protease-like protein